MDIEGEQSWKIRLVGSGIVDFFAAEFTGNNLVDYLSPAVIPSFRRAHENVITIPCGAFNRTICTTSQGRDYEMSGMALPLTRAEGNVSVLWFIQMGLALWSTAKAARPLCAACWKTAGTTSGTACRDKLPL